MIEIPERDFMIDIETMSLRKDAAIVAIGVVEIVDNAITEEVFSVRVSLESSLRRGLHVDGGTVEWWLRQIDAARRVFDEPAVDLDDMLDMLRNWMLSLGDGLVWGNGAGFDLAILKMAYDLHHMPCAWKHKQERCYRTFKELFHKVCPEPEDESEEEKHNALWDARFQATHLVSTRRYLNAMRPPRV